MSRHFRVATMLPDAQRREFHALALNDMTTVDTLHKWVVDRGHDISRTAVHRYARHVRGGLLSDMRCQLCQQSDAELRRKLASWARQLTGVALVSVAFLAAFHADVAARQEGKEKTI